jgi:hypothetical protein
MRTGVADGVGSANILNESTECCSPSSIRRRLFTHMKKIMIAVMGLSLLTGTAELFAHQNTTTDTATKKKSKKKKKSTSTDTMAPKG